VTVKLGPVESLVATADVIEEVEIGEVMMVDTMDVGINRELDEVVLSDVVGDRDGLVAREVCTVVLGEVGMGTVLLLEVGFEVGDVVVDVVLGTDVDGVDAGLVDVVVDPETVAVDDEESGEVEKALDETGGEGIARRVMGYI
jgi:hypothetical protein